MECASFQELNAFSWVRSCQPQFTSTWPSPEHFCNIPGSNWSLWTHIHSLCPYCGSWMSFVKDIICIRGGNIIMMQIKLTSPFKFQFSPSRNSKKLSCEDQPHIIQGRALGLGWQAPISRMMKEGESLMPICSVSGSGSRSADWVLSSLWSHHIRSMPASLHDSWYVMWSVVKAYMRHIN